MLIYLLVSPCSTNWPSEIVNALVSRPMDGEIGTP